MQRYYHKLGCNMALIRQYSKWIFISFSFRYIFFYSNCTDCTSLNHWIFKLFLPLIIARTIGLVLGPSTALCRSFLTHCTLTNKAAGIIWRDLSKPPQRRQDSDPRPFWLLVGTPLVLGPELASRRGEHILLWRMSLYIFDILFLSSYMFV